MNSDEWAKTVPLTITGDPLWKVEAYRLGLFAADIGWHDVTKLMQDKRTFDLSDQLYRSLTMVPQQRLHGTIREDGPSYEVSFEYLLTNVPLPEL